MGPCMKGTSVQLSQAPVVVSYCLSLVLGPSSEHIALYRLYPDWLKLTYQLAPHHAE